MKRFLIIELEYIVVSMTDDAILANKLAMNQDGLYSVIDTQQGTILDDGINGELELFEFDGNSVDEDGYPIDTPVPPADGEDEDSSPVNIEETD